MFLLSIFIEVIYQIARVNPCGNLSTNSSEIGSHRRGSPISIVLILTDVVPTDVVLLSVLYWSHSSNCTGKPMWQFINHLFQCTPPKWVLGYLISYEAMSLKTLNTQDRCLEVVEVALIFYRCLTAIDIIMFLFSYKRIALLWGVCHWRHSTSRHWSHWRSHSCAPMLNSYRWHTNSRAVQAHCHG